MQFEEGQAVLCIVEKIVGTTVFVKIESGGEGTIVTSEIAPGRIRNLRDYVSPGRKIVCRILRIDASGNMYLSLRRVTSREKKEVLDIHEKEKGSMSILKSVLHEKVFKVAEEIKKESSLHEFLENCKTSPEKLNKYLNGEEAERVCKILSEKKEKIVEVKKKFSLKTEAGDGIERVKRILPESAVYIAAGKFSITIKDSNYKDANHKIDKMLEEIEHKAKQENCVFAVEK